MVSVVHKFWLPALAVAAMAGLSLMLFFSGNKYGPPAAVIVALSPIIVYFALTRPLVAPYAVYAMLVPFDNVLAISSGTTLTKFLGLFSTGAVLLWAMRRRAFTRPSVTLGLCALFVLWLCASTMWALEPRMSFNILPTYIGLFLLYIVLSIAPIERRDFIVILVAMVAGSLVASAYGIVVFHNQSVSDAQALADNYGRLRVNLGDNTIDPNAYSDAILLPFCVLFITGLRSSYFLTKIGAAAGVAVMLAAIYVSASRGAIIAIGAAVMYLLLRSRYKLQVLLIAVLPAIALISTSSLLDRFADAQRTGAAGRFGIWKVGFEAFKQHWLGGAGIGNYRTVYNSVFIHVYQAYSGGWDRVAHSLIVQVSAELGIVGLVLILAFWMSNLFLLKHIKPDNPWYDYRIALEAAVVGLFVAALSVDLVWFKYAWLVFATVAQLRALTLAAATPVPKREAVARGVPWGARPVTSDFLPHGRAPIPDS